MVSWQYIRKGELDLFDSPFHPLVFYLVYRNTPTLSCLLVDQLTLYLAIVAYTIVIVNLCLLALLIALHRYPR